MAETLLIDSTLSREEKYKQLLPQVEALISYETDLVANLGNVAAALKFTLDVLWVGFYLVKDEQLVLGPFQGPIACTRIGYAKGVCGTSWAEKRTILVPDVEQFPGHIACSSLSRSEIVVPVIKQGRVEMVLDIDSQELADFSETDQRYLEQLAELLARKI